MKKYSTMPRTPPRPSPLCFFSSSFVWYVQKNPQMPRVTIISRIVRPLLWNTPPRSVGTAPRAGNEPCGAGGGAGEDGGGWGGGGGSFDIGGAR